MEPSRVAAHQEIESAWLLSAVGRILWTIAYFLFWLGVGLDWPLDKVGNGLQLLGVLIASLGIPVVSPFLARVESLAEEYAGRVRRRLLALRRRVRRFWARLLRRPNVIEVSATVTGKGSVSASLRTPFRRRVDRDSVGERDWLAYLDDEVHALWTRVGATQQESVQLRRRLDEQRRELRAHTLAVTRQGWEFILGGAGCSSAGTILGLAA